MRIYRLGDQNIWWDEGLAIWAVRKSFVGTTLWTAADVHPPLYFWFLWPWVRLVGESEFAARYLTLVFGMLSVALAYSLGRRVAGQGVGVLAALLVALSRFEVWWSQEMRMYMLAGLLGSLATYWLLRWFAPLQAIESVSGFSGTEGGGRKARTSPNPSRGQRMVTWGAYVLAMAGALYTIYLSIIFVIVHNLWVLGRLLRSKGAGRRTLLRGWCGAQGAVAVLLLPWLMLALPRMQSWRVIEEPPRFRFVAQLYSTLLATGVSTHLNQMRLPTLLVLGMVAIGSLWVLRPSQASRRSGVWLLLGFLVIPPVLVWVITQPRSIFYSPRVEARYLVPFAAPAYGFFALALGEIWRRWRPAGGLAGVVVLGVFVWMLPAHYQGRYLRDELQSMVQTLYAYAQPTDGVVLVSGNRYPVFLYYYERKFRDPSLRPPVYQVPAQSLQLTPDNVEVELSPIVSRHERVWLAEVEALMQDPAGLAEMWLNERRQRPLSLGFAHNALHLYALSDAEPLVPAARWMYPLEMTLPAGNIPGYDLATREFRPGDVVRLGVYVQEASPAPLIIRWGPDGFPPLAQQVLRLPDSAGGVIRRQVEFAVSEVVPAGRYHFELVDASGPVFGQFQVDQTHGPDLQARPEQLMRSQVGDFIHFLGYRLVDTRGRPRSKLEPGGSFYLDLFWQVEAPVAQRLTVFAHLLGEEHNPATGGPVWAGHDSEPWMGALPFPQWSPGSIIPDRHPLVLDTNTPPGMYQLEVGLYDPTTGERLPVQGDGADGESRRLLLGFVEVTEAEEQR